MGTAGTVSKKYRRVWHSRPWGKGVWVGGMGGIRLKVLSQEGEWRISIGEKVSRPFRSQNEAIRAALDRAQALGRQGHESEVVLKVLTCQFGPNNFFRTVPTPRNPPEDAD